MLGETVRDGKRKGLNERDAVLASLKPSASEESVKVHPLRIVLRPPVGSDGLFTEPPIAQGNKAQAQREMVERINRLNFVSHFHYEDPWARIAPSSTYDTKGNYNCGACNKLDGADKCLLIPITVDPIAGSCEHWEIHCASDRETDISMMGVTAEDAMYGIAQNGKGFGCHRCPYSSPAGAPDSVGRDLYCGKGDFRVPRNACCGLNGAPLVSEYEGNDVSAEEADEKDEDYAPR